MKIISLWSLMAMLAVLPGCARTESVAGAAEEQRMVELQAFATNPEATAAAPSGHIRVDMTQPMPERLQRLADSIYGPGWFTAHAVQTVNGAQVATIELTDPHPAPAHNPVYTPWYARFQGSTGSSLTAELIHKTFGQTMGKPGWPDRIEYVYSGWLGSHADDQFHYQRLDECATCKIGGTGKTGKRTVVIE